jgi:hypothetical protein
LADNFLIPPGGHLGLFICRDSDTCGSGRIISQLVDLLFKICAAAQMVYPFLHDVERVAFNDVLAIFDHGHCLRL